MKADYENKTTRFAPNNKRAFSLWLINISVSHRNKAETLGMSTNFVKKNVVHVQVHTCFFQLTLIGTEVEKIFPGLIN